MLSSLFIALSLSLFIPVLSLLFIRDRERRERRDERD
jgi:hypothetical protein